MRCDKGIYIASVATWMPEVVPVAPAVAQGLVDEMHSGLGYETVAVGDGVAGAELAIRAGKTAVARAGIPLEEYGLLLHGSLWFQGLDMWGTANYVANETVGSQAVSFDVQQRSCGGMGAFHLATAYLTSGYASTAMITTGDAFAPPAFDRWNSQMFTIFGDAGTAMVLSTHGGFARVLASDAFADNSLEGWGRGTEPFVFTPALEQPIPVLRRAAQHMATPAAEGSWERIEATMLKTRDQVLGNAGVDQADIKRTVLPFIHRGAGMSENYDTFGFTEEQSLWGYGKTVGHLGAGDQFAGLNHLIETKAVEPGDKVFIFSLGVGFSSSAAVIEILDLPAL